VQGAVDAQHPIREDCQGGAAMSHTITSLAIVLSVLAARATAADDEGKRMHYDPTWESLNKHPMPKWFQDAS
jgi:hypothetical protein